MNTKFTQKQSAQDKHGDKKIIETTYQGRRIIQWKREYIKQLFYSTYQARNEPKIFFAALENVLDV